MLFRAICQLLFLSVLAHSCAFANSYTLPAADNNLIGKIDYTTSGPNETLVSIGQKYNVGVNAMLSANPGFSETTPLPPETRIKIPSRFLLPPGPRKGIVINLPEMRMYYYPKESDEVMTFPIGIGKVGRTIPITHTAIMRKTVNPTWIPPQSIRQFNKEQGVDLPQAMGPGPDNPLGPYAIYLKLPTFLIHSTIFPESIGRRASFGCIRMHENDIKEFFPLVKSGIPVDILNMPDKLGWVGNKLFLESHQPLEEKNEGGISSIVGSIQAQSPRDSVTFINWTVVAYVVEQRDGLPHEIGFRVR